jgi:LmbE family N-acetylglucosaminyl deacetylase
MQNNFPHPQRVLVICAHPDDPEFGAAGTVACWTESGAEVIYVIVTDGSKGSSAPEMTREELIDIRAAEQRAAASILGVSEIIFLGYPDGQVYNTSELRGDIVRQIRLHKPDIVVTHDPTTRIINNAYLNHPDHRAVGDTVLDAIFPLARDRLNFPEHEEEGLTPHNVLDIFLIFTNEPNYWVDVSKTMDKMIAALQEHRSQVADPEELENRLRERARKRAEKVSFEYAEHFRRVTLPR